MINKLNCKLRRFRHSSSDSPKIKFGGNQVAFGSIENCTWKLIGSHVRDGYYDIASEHKWYCIPIH